MHRVALVGAVSLAALMSARNAAAALPSPTFSGLTLSGLPGSPCIGTNNTGVLQSTACSEDAHMTQGGAPSSLAETDSSGNISAQTVLATGGTTARTLGARAADTANALDFGADSTGAADSTAAIRAALATGKSVRLPCGSYHITNTLTVGAVGAQRLFGDGACSRLTVGADFNSSASGVIVLEGATVPLTGGNAQVDHFWVSFAQPPDAITTASVAGSGNTVSVASTTGINVGNYAYDQTTSANLAPLTTVTAINGTSLTLSNSAASVTAGDSLHFGPARAQFKTLAQGCTTGVGGTGCEYPWAIYATGYQQLVIRNIGIAAAWDGIYLYNAGTSTVDDVRVGAIDNGMLDDGSSDALLISQFKFNAFGFWNTVLENDMMWDGNTKCMTPGRTDGGNYSAIDCFMGKITLLPTFTWATMTGVSMDGPTAEFTIPAGLPASSYLMLGDSHLENIGAFSGGCMLSVASAQLIASGLRLDISNANDGPDVCVHGGVLSLSGSYIIQNQVDQPAVVQSGGEMSLTANLLQAAPGTATVSPVQITGGVYHVLGNTIDGPILNGLAAINVTAPYAGIPNPDAIAGNAIPDDNPIAYNGTAGFMWPNADGASQGGVKTGLWTTMVAPQTVTATSGTTLTAAELQSDYLTRSGPTANFTDTTDSAQAMGTASGIVHPVAGQNWKIRIINASSYTMTIAGGINVTMSGTTTIAPGSWREYVITLTSVSTSGIFASMTSVGAGTN